MPSVNERCKILRSLNRVSVFEIVLLLVPRLKILRRTGLSYFWDFRETKRHSRVPKKQTTTGEAGSEVDSRSTSSSNSWARKALCFRSTQLGSTGGMRNSAGDLRQLVVSILLYSCRFQIAIGILTPCKCGRWVLRRSIFEIRKGQATISGHDLFQ